MTLCLFARKGSDQCECLNAGVQKALEIEAIVVVANSALNLQSFPAAAEKRHEDQSRFPAKWAKSVHTILHNTPRGAS